MKEIQETPKDKTEMSKEQEKKFQQNYLGSIRNMPKSHTLFEFNKQTLEITKAVFESQSVNFEDVKSGKVINRKKLVVKEDCIYIPALNVKNVIKKLKKYS